MFKNCLLLGLSPPTPIRTLPTKIDAAGVTDESTGTTGGGEAVVRHHKLCLSIDIERRIYGYTELHVVVPENEIVGLHSDRRTYNLWMNTKKAKKTQITGCNLQVNSNRNLAGCVFTGGVPYFISLMTKIEYINLSRNQL
ncbi:hypothetical protein ACET3Z_014154 [Daucus carota]